MEETYEEFRRGLARRLREIRGELTQAQLAEMARYTQQMVSRYESGRVPRSYWFLANLASRAGVDVGYLLTGERPRPARRRRKKPA